MRRIGSLAAAKPPTNGIEKHRLSGLPSLNYFIFSQDCPSRPPPITLRPPPHNDPHLARRPSPAVAATAYPRASGRCCARPYARHAARWQCGALLQQRVSLFGAEHRHHRRHFGARGVNCDLQGAKRTPICLLT